MEEKKNFFYTFIICLFFVVLKLFYRLNIIGKKNIPKTGPVILVSNHKSNIDPFVVSAVLYPRKIHSMAKEELFRNPVLSFFFRKLGAFPIHRGKYDRQAFKNSLEVLSKGQVFALFPEGRRNRLEDDKLGPLHKGAALIAIKSGAPIIPMGIKGTGKILPKGKLIPRFPKIKVKIGEPIPLIDDKTKLTEKIGEAISSILGEI
ncbi:MAG: lysophospholipid acyltransferase family protein [Candidatus Oleimmundimicrobium sp.]|nr:lysophospholipid acyltransferase family protein [Candidatus Oleimmundimicrobium sp.]